MICSQLFILGKDERMQNQVIVAPIIPCEFTDKNSQEPLVRFGHEQKSCRIFRLLYIEANIPDVVSNTWFSLFQTNKFPNFSSIF